MVSSYLEDYPVYSLKQSDFKQEVARILLEDIAVSGDSLKISLEL